MKSEDNGVAVNLSVSSIVAIGLSFVVIVVAWMWRHSYRRRAQIRGVDPASGGQLGAGPTIFAISAVLCLAIGAILLQVGAMAILVGPMTALAIMAVFSAWTTAIRASRSIAILRRVGGPIDPILAQY